MYALVDGNNFFVSCERLFRPSLHGIPVVVLSSNDGCAIARSPEAKALGVKMGQPYFELRDLEIRNGLVCCSSNFALYSDLSSRLMRLLGTMAVRQSIYSIDESFLWLGGVPGDLEALGRTMRDRAAREVGIPVGVGIAPTKTLAKLANWGAKKWKATGGVVDLQDPARQRRLLALADVGEVWGIGRQLSARLNAMGVTTALHLADYDRKTLRRIFSVNVERTARELSGERCFELEESPEPKKMIACTRSFGTRKFALQELQEAVVGYATRAGEKLRKQRQLCQAIQVFVRSSPFDKKGTPYSRAVCVALPYPSSDTRDLAAAALGGLQAIYRPGPAYAKAGVILMDFVDPGRFTPDLFAPPPRSGGDRLMAVVDAINAKQGKGTIRPARLSAELGFSIKREKLSPRFTTSWTDLLTIQS
ncbi:translesion error-prone DNA polymerase V subunit UmuC [Stutzerimonas kunmingensis]|uniref:translesion error-prone DNA polymerase V subunit UmuC n=1 Tax=Stutzerimonas kunmingensis TaxID=1211807 RepID=UPI0028A75DAF|nr:translesion error-prone DNA polymerase V subunit UmuC [Stutzerimonas kunmingensis]